jgi:hypothetical protein
MSIWSNCLHTSRDPETHIVIYKWLRHAGCVHFGESGNKLHLRGEVIIEIEKYSMVFFFIFRKHLPMLEQLLAVEEGVRAFLVGSTRKFCRPTQHLDNIRFT